MKEEQQGSDFQQSEKLPKQVVNKNQDIITKDLNVKDTIKRES